MEDLLQLLNTAVIVYYAELTGVFGPPCAFHSSDAVSFGGQVNSSIALVALSKYASSETHDQSLYLGYGGSGDCIISCCKTFTAVVE